MNAQHLHQELLQIRPVILTVTAGHLQLTFFFVAWGIIPHTFIEVVSKCTCCISLGGVVSPSLLLHLPGPTGMTSLHGMLPERRAVPSPQRRWRPRMFLE